MSERRVDYALMFRLYVKPYLNDGGALSAGWVLDDCDCDPHVEHCLRCDSRRLMRSMANAQGAP